MYNGDIKERYKIFRSTITILFVLMLTVPVSSSSAKKTKEKSDSFIIKVFHDKVKVVAPEKYEKGQHVIVENKTLVDLWGRVQTVEGKVIGFVSIKPKGFQSVELNVGKKEQIVFIPLAPPFQEIRLIRGKAAYEIPPQR